MQRSRSLRRALAALSVVVAGATAAAGCGSTGSQAGVASAASSAAPKTIKIGLATVLSGPASAYGNTDYGLMAYLNNVNRSGGVNGYKYSYVVKDTGYDPSRAATIFRSFAQSDNVFAVVAVGSGPFAGIAPIAKQTGVPTFSAVDGALVTPPVSNIWGQEPAFVRMALFNAQFAMQKLGVKDLGSIYENDDVGAPSGKVLPQYVKQNGGKLLTNIPIDMTATDFSPYAAKLKQSGAKVVLSTSGPVVLAGVQKAAAAIGYKPKWITLFGSEDPAYLALAGPLAQGVYLSSYQFPLDSSDPSVVQFRQVMSKAYPKAEFSSFAQQGWNFAVVINDAVKQATAGGKSLTRARFLSAVESIRGPQVGMMRDVNYGDPSTHAPTQSSAILQIAGKKYRVAQGFTTLPEAPN